MKEKLINGLDPMHALAMQSGEFEHEDFLEAIRALKVRGDLPDQFIPPTSFWKTPLGRSMWKTYCLEPLTDEERALLECWVADNPYRSEKPSNIIRVRTLTTESDDFGTDLA